MGHISACSFTQALRKYIMSGKKLGDEQLDKLRKLIAEYTESFAA